MGNPLFGVNISKLINDNIGTGVNDATLTKVAPGTATPGQLTGGTNPTEMDYACKGFVDPIDRNRLAGTLVVDGDVTVNIVGDSIASAQVPEPGDKVTILSKEYEIISVEVDPALALYVCVGRAN